MFTTDPTAQYFMTMLRDRAAQLRKEKDRGGMSIEAAILVGILVALAIGLGVFLTTKMSEKTGQIK